MFSPQHVLIKRFVSGLSREPKVGAKPFCVPKVGSQDVFLDILALLVLAVFFADLGPMFNDGSMLFSMRCALSLCGLWKD